MSALIRYLFIISFIVIAIQCQSQTLDWVNQYSGSISDAIRGITVSQQKDCFVTGVFRGTLDLDPGISVFNVASDNTGDDDIFLARYDSLGVFDWGFKIDGEEPQSVRSIELNGSNDVIISGAFKDTVDFDPSGNSLVKNGNAEWNVFVASYSALGVVNWVSTFESLTRVNYRCMTLDQSGNIYVGIDHYDSVDVDPGPNRVMEYASGYFPACLVKLNSNGDYLWHIQFGDSGTVKIDDIRIQNDELYLFGRFTKSFDIDPSINTFILLGTNSGQFDRFLTRFDTSGAFHWGIWHSGNDVYKGELFVDQNDIYYLNVIDGSADFVPNDPSGNVTAIDAYGVTLLDTSGNYDTTYVISANGNEFRAKLLSNKELVLHGEFSGNADVSMTGSSYPISSVTGSGVFIAKYEPDLTLKNVLVLEGNDLFPTAVDVDNQGNPYGAGWFGSQSDFDPTLDTFILNPNSGIGDSFIAKFGPCISQDTTDTLYICPGDSILIGDVYRDTAGIYNDTLRAFNSCDSIVAYTLIVNPSQSFGWWGDTLKACDGDSLFFHAGNTLTNSWLWHDGSTAASWSDVFDHNNPIDSIAVTVGDINGCSQTGKAVIVDNTIDNFGAIVNSPQNPLASFSGVMPTNVDSFYWDFGDGTMLANVVAPTHQYTSFGTYEVCLYVLNECGSDSSCKTVEIGPVGITENNQEEAIHIFPNPSQDGMFTLQTTQMGQLTIFDGQGKLLMQRQINSPKTLLNLQSQGSGIYLLELQLENTTLRQQLVVE